MSRSVGQDGILRPIANRPSCRLHFMARGRLPIGRRIPSCPTSSAKFHSIRGSESRWGPVASIPNRGSSEIEAGRLRPAHLRNVKLSTMSPGTLSPPRRAGSNCHRLTALMVESARASGIRLPPATGSAAITLPAASTLTFTRTTTSPVIDLLILSDTIGANCRMALGGV